MLGDIDLVGHDSAVKALVKQKIGAFLQRSPFGEGPRRCAIQLGFFVIVDVVACGAAASLAIIAKYLLQLLEEICFRTEVAEVLVAALAFLNDFGAHLGAVVAMERIALDVGRRDLFATKDNLERLLDRRRAGAR